MQDMARFVAKALRVCSGLPYTVLDPALKLSPPSNSRRPQILAAQLEVLSEINAAPE